MVARLFLSILILALAAPAIAMPACHPPVEEAGSHVGHPVATGHAPADSVPRDAHPHAEAPCIGCIAPSTVRPPLLDAFRPDDRAMRVVRGGDGAPLRDLPPATPPPRKG